MTNDCVMITECPHPCDCAVALLTRLSDMLSSSLRESLVDVDMAYARNSLKHGFKNYALRKVVQVEQRSHLSDEKLVPRLIKRLEPAESSSALSITLQRRYQYVNPVGEITTAAAGLRDAVHAWDVLVNV